ncbi:hypothetical protein [Pseudorhodoferax sp. Leaf265]|uniref:hypothetical protein n=1 Tax=Pseudorhodoferax sp. Leaf265 TaxID=1736315 RepID=UPI0006FEA3A5|nr:hypothetical protein [Pseudorhodoferax sp. Leaf265]KQP17021.1 hypothetical protein ASF45_27770 [Pseudorhodoferax sp. Leaf265]
MAKRSRSGSGSRAGQGGLGYLVLLFWLALGSVALTGEAILWSMERRREREEELLFAGDQVRRAIGSYYEAASEPKQYPPSLESLLEDSRSYPPRRHLRQPYPDPIGQGTPFKLIRGSHGGIIGVHSASVRAPIKRTGFSVLDAEFEGKDDYSQWTFIHHAAITRIEPARIGTMSPTKPF